MPEITVPTTSEVVIAVNIVVRDNTHQSWREPNGESHFEVTVPLGAATGKIVSLDAILPFLTAQAKDKFILALAKEAAEKAAEAERAKSLADALA